MKPDTVGVCDKLNYYYFCTLGSIDPEGWKLSKLKKAGRLKVLVDITFKRLMQQDGVNSLQSDRESLKEK